MKRHIAYFRYVARHKWFVFWACMKLRVPLWQALVHDWTKYTRVEWGDYAKTFYNKDGSPVSLRDKSGAYDPNAVLGFQRAWCSHQKAKHHWQAWVSIGTSGMIPISIPERYIREMIADWVGAGMAQTKRRDPTPWYETNKDTMILTPETRLRIEEILNEVYLHN